MDVSLIVAFVGVGGTLLGSAIASVASIIKEKMHLANERKMHIIKARFDNEFKFYQELNETMIRLHSSCRTICSAMKNFIGKSSLPEEDDNYFCENGARFIDDYRDAEIELAKCAPFIDKKIYTAYGSFLEKTKDIALHFQRLNIYFHDLGELKENELKMIEENKDETISSIDKSFEEITELLQAVMDMIKNHINSLEEKQNG
jgi:hypothetical protein